MSEVIKVDQNELRKLCAEEAMKYIKSGTTIGLGAGRNIDCLIELLSQEVKKGLIIKIVTPSYHTKDICLSSGLDVTETSFISGIDIAFDGCGEVDKSLYASKGGGGIYTREKIIASMAKEYILLIDQSKYCDKLTTNIPVSLEVIRYSLSYVKKKVEELGGVPTVRKSNSKDGYMITDDGNFLIDINFDSVIDWKELNDSLKNVTGVIETSIFTNEVTKIIMARENEVEVISRVNNY
jgi:ribose 5-phosphate isomerase A